MRGNQSAEKEQHFTSEMGVCASCETREEVTSKVILQDGKLREFSRPVKAADVLDDEGRAWFVCDADEMDFDGFLSELAADDELQPGQIYFILPQAMLRKPLQAKHLAALAAKASTALVKAAPTGKRLFRRRSVAPQPLVFAEAPAAVRGAGRKFGKGRGSASRLTAIQE